MSVTVRRRVGIQGYDRDREGRPEHVRDYVQERELRSGVDARPGMTALRRRDGMFPRTGEQRERALRDATKKLSVLQRKVNSRNSSGVFAEAVDDLMASLRRGDPDMRLANDLAAHVSTLRRGERMEDVARHQVDFAEEHPGYVAHGYITSVPDAYDILDQVRHDVVFEYGGNLPGSVVEYRSEGTAETPSIGVYEGGEE